MESSQHDSPSQGREIAKEGERGDKEASSSDQAKWSFVDFISTFTFRDAHKIVARYSMDIALP